MHLHILHGLKSTAASIDSAVCRRSSASYRDGGLRFGWRQGKLIDKCREGTVNICADRGLSILFWNRCPRGSGAQCHWCVVFWRRDGMGVGPSG